MPERRMSFNRRKKAGPDYHPIHDSIFGADDEIAPLNEDALPGADTGLMLREEEDEPKPMVDDAPPGVSRANVYMENSPGQPARFQPMRDVGDTDPTDRQPDGTLRR